MSLPGVTPQAKCANRQMVPDTLIALPAALRISDPLFVSFGMRALAEFRCVFLDLSTIFRRPGEYHDDRHVMLRQR
jgi:hypothetical protein